MSPDDKDDSLISGDSLDHLLSEARWPAAPPLAVARITQHWEKVWKTRRRREVLMSRAAALGLVVGLLVAVTIGWLRLRPEEKSIAEVPPSPAHSPERPAPAIESTPLVTKSAAPNKATSHETRRPTEAELCPSRPPNPLEELLLAASDRKRKRPATSPKVAKSASPSNRSSRPLTVGSNSVVNAPRKTRRQGAAGPDEETQRAMVKSVIQRLVTEPKVDVAQVAAKLASSSPNSEKFLLLTVNDGTRPQQIAAVRLLAETGTPASVGPLLRAAEEPQLHSASIEALASLADPSLVSELARVELSSELRRTLMAALLARGEPTALGEFLSFVENDRTTDAALAAAQSVKQPPMELLFSTLSQPLEAHRIAAARVIGRIDGAATTQRLITMVELGVNRHEACIALLSSRGEEATRYVNAAAQRDPSLAAILSGARMFTQLDNPPRS